MSLASRWGSSRGRAALATVLGALVIASGASYWLTHRSPPTGRVLILMTVAAPSAPGEFDLRGKLSSLALRGAGGAAGEVSLHLDTSFSLTRSALAPGTAAATVVGIPAGTYGTAQLTYSLGGRQVVASSPVRLQVTAGQLAPLLFSFHLPRAGRPSLQAAYGGNQEVNFGLQVAAGTVMSVPQVTLTDQFGHPVSLREYRGKVVILANFLTECQETCPLVAAALLQLQRVVDREQLQGRVQIVEVTQDPAGDTPPILRRYQQRFGLSWPLLTGSQATIDRFWAQLKVPPVEALPWNGPAQVDQFSGLPEPYNLVHASVLDVINPEGYVVTEYQSWPQLSANSLPKTIHTYLDSQGLQQLHSGGSWTPQSLLDSITPLLRQEGVYTSLGATGGVAAVGRPAPGFVLPSTTGGRGSLAADPGHPVLIDFWATWCTNCRADMRLVTSQAQRYRGRGLQLLLVDYEESRSTVLGFLRQQAIPVPSLLDSSGQIALRYGVPGLPVAVFVSSSGRIAAIQVGQLQPQELAQDLAKILGS